MGKIDLSKATEALKKLGFLRTYSMLLLPLVIILAAAGVFTAALLMGRSFRDKVAKQSIPLGREIKSRLGNVIPLGQVEVERHYQEKYLEDVNLIKRMAIQSTQRELLSYDIFPRPKETSTMLFSRFAERFCEQIEGMIRRVNGQDAPTEEEIGADVRRGGGSMLRGPSLIRPGAAGGVDTEKIVEEICRARARSASVYVNPVDISGYLFWEGYKYTNMEEAVMDCWHWQLGYWIIEDVFSTVEAMNKGLQNVYSSPVKRIVSISFRSPYMVSRGMRFGRSQVSQDRPRYVIKREDLLTEPCTGRMSDNDVNVVHFSMIAVVSHDAVLPFMEELCSGKGHRFAGYNGNEPVRIYKHNQISILESKVRPVLPEGQSHKLYRYGPEAVMELELICEYIFNKKGYEPINPELAGKPEA